jgi:hypothetical protein
VLLNTVFNFGQPFISGTSSARNNRTMKSPIWKPKLAAPKCWPQKKWTKVAYLSMPQIREPRLSLVVTAYVVYVVRHDSKVQKLPNDLCAATYTSGNDGVVRSPPKS